MNRTRFASSFILAAIAAVALPRVAVAQEQGPKTEAVPRVEPNSPSGIFGGEGQLAISSDAGLSISNTSVTGGNGSTTTLVMRPAVDYFIIDNLSLGGFLGLDYTHTTGSNATVFSIGPRVGYNIPITKLLSFWPKAGLSYAHTNIDSDVQSTSSSNSLALNLFAPVMVHPAVHFFIGFGPALDVDLTGDPKSTTIAGRLTIGGWI